MNRRKVVYVPRGHVRTGSDNSRIWPFSDFIQLIGINNKERKEINENVHQTWYCRSSIVPKF